MTQYLIMTCVYRGNNWRWGVGNAEPSQLGARRHDKVPTMIGGAMPLLNPT